MTFTPIIKTVQSADGTAIYAEAIGDPRKPAIVMVHGMCLSAAVFDSFFHDRRMLDDVYMVRYDMRGHGRSGKPTSPEAHTSTVWAADYTAVMAAFSVKKHIFLGWSYGGTVAADVCANISPNPLAGIVYMAGLPYVGPIMGVVGTSVIHGFLSRLTDTSDVEQHDRTRIEFVDTLVNEPESFNFNTKAAWLGHTLLHPPIATQLIISRPQDPSKLLDAGEQGLPMLVLYGTTDKQVNGDAIVNEMRPHFRDLEPHAIEGGSHALMVEHKGEVVNTLLEFVFRVGIRGL